MIKNSKVSLKKDSQIRIDACNTLKYTLLLDYEIPEISDEKDWVTSIMNACQRCCKGIFGFNEKNRNMWYDFFGRSDVEKTFPLECLDSVHDDSIGETSKEEPSFHKMILQHCVMAAYHAILTEILDGKKATSYEIANKVRSDGQSSGIHYLCNKGLYSLETGAFKKKDSLVHTNIKKSSAASDFQKVSETHKEILKGCSIFGDKVEEVPIQFADVWSRICRIPATGWRVYGEKEDIDYNTALIKIEQLCNSVIQKNKNYSIIPEKNFKDSHGDVVDGLYAHYILERVFNFNLIYSLLKHIKQCEEKTNYRFQNKELLKTMTSFKRMPNAFSRQCFLGYAMEKVLSEPKSCYDFWYWRDLKKDGAIVFTTEYDEQYFQFTIWEKQYRLFVNHMSEYVIPIYEWCFVCMLMETVEDKYPDMTYEKHLILAMELLAQYMKKHSAEILQPIEIDKREADLYSIALEHKNLIEIEEVNQNIIGQVIKMMVHFDGDIDLNLKKFGPEYFKQNKNPNGRDFNFERLQKVYTNFVRFTYFEH